MRTKPTLVIDFDGVIHSYEKGWQNGVIYGTVVSGFFEWAVEAKKLFILAIYSSRSDSHKNIKPMKDWLSVHLMDWQWEDWNVRSGVINITDFEFPTQKPAGFVSIDDRAITFKGRWDAEELKPENLINFKTWTQEKGNEPVKQN